jgi:putative transposase
MPRTARAVAVDYPHHITQRGNNRELVFFDDQDRQTYLDLLKHYTQKYKVSIWAYCLMPNHIHLLAVPHEQKALALGVGRTNMVYTRYVNRKYLRSGRVWQNRFYSCIVDSDEYLWAVARYIEVNSVKAGLVPSATEFLWSSARFHLEGKADLLMASSDWLSDEKRSEYCQFILESDERTSNMIIQATRSGRPLCSSSTLVKLEELLGRSF